jgi:hypothetical protein
MGRKSKKGRTSIIDSDMSPQMFEVCPFFLPLRERLLTVPLSLLLLLRLFAHLHDLDLDNQGVRSVEIGFRRYTIFELGLRQF